MQKSSDAGPVDSVKRAEDAGLHIEDDIADFSGLAFSFLPSSPWSCSRSSSPDMC